MYVPLIAGCLLTQGDGGDGCGHDLKGEGAVNCSIKFLNLTCIFVGCNFNFFFANLCQSVYNVRL